MRCRPHLLPVTSVTTKFPDFDSPSSPTPHVWTLRQIESEVTFTLYYPTLNPEEPVANASLDQWFARTHDRLYAWHQKTRQSVDLTEKIEFHEIHFHLQILKLNRPSPRNPQPTAEMQKRALKSAIALVREFSVIERLGKLFYIWHAAYCIVQSGIYLLASVLVGMNSIDTNRRHVAGEDVVILTKYIKIFPSLLWKISRRWSNIEQHASTLEAISSSVLDMLQRWSDGGIVRSTDIDILKTRLSQHSEFPPFASQTTPTAMSPPVAQPALEGMNSTFSTPGFGLSGPGPSYPVLQTNGQYSDSVLTSSSVNPYPAMAPATFQVSTSENTPFSSAGISDPPSLEPIDSMFPNSYGLNGGEAFEWDFSGMDYKELFAALLEGGGTTILDDLITS